MPRRTYSQEFKGQVLAECQLSGESIAGVALRHGISANLIHKWRRGRQRAANTEFLRLPTPGGPMAPVSPAPSKPAETIRLDVTVGQSHVTVHWPVSQLHKSVEWLKALTQ